MTSRDVDRPSCIAAAAAITGVGALFVNAMPVVLGAIDDSLALGTERLGYLASWHMLGYTAMTVTLILWARKVDWRIALRVAALVFAASYLVASRLTDFYLLTGALFVAGLSAGVVFGIGTTSIADTKNPDRGFGIATFAQVGLGTILTLLLTKAIVPAWGASGSLLALAVCGAAGIGLAGFSAAGGARPGSVRSTHGGSTLAPLVALAGSVVLYVGVSGMWAFIERMGSGAGLSQEFVGSVVSAGLLAGGAAAAAAAVLGDRLGRAAILTLSGMGLLGSLGLLSFADAYRFALAVPIFNVSWTFAIIYGLAVVAATDTSGRFVVAIPAALGVGFVIGPSLGGTVLTKWGIAGFGIMASVSIVLAVGLFLSALVLSSRRATIA